jgi:Ca2+-binding RTX toxin-like protein
MDNVNWSAFGLSFTDEVLTIIDNTIPGQVIYSVANNPAVDQFVISYSPVAGGFIINDVVASRDGYLVFEAHNVGSFITSDDIFNNDLFSNIPLDGFNTFNGNSYDDVIDAGAGDDVVYGNGGNDTVFGGFGNDYLVGGAGYDVLYGGYGDDTFVLDNPFDQFADDGGIDTLIVTYNDAALPDGPNWIENLVFSGVGDFYGRGNLLSNVIIGGNGKDKLAGMGGNDILTGGLGKDAFMFNTKLGTSKTDRKVNFDTLNDFSTKDDSLYLDNAIFKKLGKKGSEQKPVKLDKKFFALDKAKDKDDYVIYNKKTGVLSYDADGSGKGQAVEFALLKNKATLKYDDFFVI